MSKPFIYANGDSFVAGSELGDHLVSTFPGTYHIDDTRPSHIENWHNLLKMDKSSSVYLEHSALSASIHEQEQTRNFSYKVSKLLNCKHLNNAKGGSGNDSIARKTIRDLIELKKTEKNIIALIGTSDPGRLELPVANLICWEDRSIGASPRNAVTDYFLLNFNIYNRMVMFYKNVIFLQDFCKLNQIKLLWIAGNSNIINDHIIEEQYKQEKDLVNFIDYANFSYAIDMPDIAREIKFNTMMPGYHFSEIVHEKTAERLLERI